jgi:hypothetical protein
VISGEELMLIYSIQEMISEPARDLHVAVVDYES